jgi:hypothetical protein
MMRQPMLVDGRDLLPELAQLAAALHAGWTHAIAEDTLARL